MQSRCGRRIRALLLLLPCPLGFTNSPRAEKLLRALFRNSGRGLQTSGHTLRHTSLSSNPSTEGESKMSIHIASPEISEQEDLKFQPSSEHQKQNPENAGSQDPPTPSSFWSPIAGVLGALLLCLLLLIAARILGSNIIFLSRQQEDLIQQLENLTHQLSICQVQNANVSENLQHLTQERGHKNSPCPEKWIHQGQASYLFSDENKTWQSCNSSCSSRESRLLKIDGQEELDFIKKASYQHSEDRQGLSYYFPFWIGLSYDSSTKKWIWVDGAVLVSSLFHIPGGPPENFQSGACVYFQGGNAKAGNCGETRFCLCEKIRGATDQLD